MAAYELVLPRNLDRRLRRLSGHIERRIRDRLDQLRGEPRPHWVKRLRGRRALWAFRVGDYRVIFQVDDATRRIVVADIDLRDRIYQGLGGR